MATSAEMPYFVKPSINMPPQAKKAAYERAAAAIDANLQGEQDPILKMATINCLLKTFLSHYYWVGFYLVREGRLSIGPYQGTLGCLHIDFSRGVCGKAARERRTQIVPDTHLLEDGTEHIACDPHSNSEIVVPIYDKNGVLLAVLDVDSTEKNSFDSLDQSFLEEILHRHFAGE